MKTLEIFEASLQLGKYVGLIRPNIDGNGRYRTLKHVLSWVQFITVQIIVCFGSIKFILSLTIEDDIRNRGIPYLCGLAFFSGTAFISTTTYIAVDRHFDNFCSRLDNHKKIYGDHNGYLWIHKSTNSRPLLWICFAVQNVIVGLFIYFTFHQRNSLTNLFWPFNFNSILNTIIGMTYCTLFTYVTTSHQLLIAFLFTTSSLLFIKEFELINDRLKTVISDSSRSASTHFEKIRQEHTSLLGCFEMSKRLYKHYIFAIYAVSVPVFGFFLYGVIRGKMHMAETVTLFGIVILNGIATLVYTCIGANLHTKAHEPYDMLNKVHILEVCDKTVESVSIFMNRLTGRPIAYTIYSMMTLDSSAILQLFGTLVTYAIVMLQFAGTTPSGVNQCYNSTAVY